MVCGKEKNPVHKITVGLYNFYLCNRHALILYEELGNLLRAQKQVKDLYSWAKRRGIRVD